jgi:ribulose-phosphate 3-epimerase
MIKIAPSILSADFAVLAEEIAKVEAAADLLHVDVMDGHFVPNLTLGPGVVEAIKRRTRLPLDVHLMIEAPERHLAAFARAGADILTVHVETCPHLHRTLQQIRETGAKAGVSLNPATPLAALDHILGDVDLVLIMSVNPGFGGQQFIPGALGKIAEAAKRLRALPNPPELEVDGGIKPENCRQAAAAGATILVAGSAVFGAPDPGAAVRALRERADGA